VPISGPSDVRPEIGNDWMVGKKIAVQLWLLPRTKSNIDKGEDRDESIYVSKCKLGKESDDGFECAAAIPPKSSNFWEEKPSHE
jgi:hypothetical protein